MASKKAEVPEDQPVTDGDSGKMADARRMAGKEPVNIKPVTQSEPELPNTPEQPTAPEKTFTQAELDAIVSDRLRREREKYSDYKDLKAKASQLDEIEQAKLDETEKLRLKLEKAEQAAVEATNKAKGQAVTNALLMALTGYKTDNGLGIRKDALEAAIKLVDVSSLEYADNGEVSGISDAVLKLIEQNSFLLEQPRQATTSPTNPAKDTKTGTTDEQRRAVYFGGGIKGGFFSPKENVVLPD